MSNLKSGVIMARKSKIEKESETLFYLLFILPGFLVYLATQSLKTTIWIMVVYWAVLISLLILRNKRLREKLRSSGITEIDKMDGIQFEHYLKELFTSLGYNAKN